MRTTSMIVTTRKNYSSSPAAANWMTLLCVLVSIPVWAVMADASDCLLECQNEATCTAGAADFSNHPVADLASTSTNLGSPSSSSSSSSSSYHCACTQGWTGVLCDVPYLTCDTTDHPCYNNGLCVPGSDQFGNSQQYCNCESAVVNGVPHVGKYCEHAATDYCDDAHTIFCIHGSCNLQYPSGGGPCICDAGYKGPSCQYEVDAVPDCDLACVNGGVCSLDYAADEPAFMFWEEGGDDIAIVNHENMRCVCPPGFSGRLCDIATVECGNVWCYHGGTCVERAAAATGDGDGDGSTTTQYDCDCTGTYTATESYAGSMCQYAATSFCTKTGTGTLSSVSHDNLFCVNGGRCKANPLEGCECNDPYTGFSCEFILEDDYDDRADIYDYGSLNITDDDQHSVIFDDQDMPPIAPLKGDVQFDNDDVTMCDIQCRNGGHCRVGVKDYGVLEDIAQNQIPSFTFTDDSAMNTPTTTTTSNDNLMHCVCPDGYYGNTCEKLVAICGDNEHLCLNGGTCIRNDQDEHACDCSPDHDNNSAAQEVIYAGVACEHEVSVNNVCSVEAAASLEVAPMSFCVHGTCKQRSVLGEEHHGCDCYEGFSGPHCELRGNDDQVYTDGNSGFNNHSQNASQLSPGAIFAIVLVLVVFFLGGLCSGRYCTRRRRYRKNLAKSSSKWGDSLFRDGYSDEPGSGINIAPRKGSVVYDEADVAAAMLVSSSRDPMATRLAPKTGTTTSALPVTARGFGGSTVITPPSLLPPPPPLDADVDDDDDLEPQPTIYIGPPRDEDGHVLHNVEIC